MGGTVQGDPVKDIILTALQNGINMFDTAESYADGKSELEMGRVLRELDIPRAELVITTKLFWGGGTNKLSPNSWGLSRKHIIEGTKESLERLGIDYVDVIFAHRCDVNVSVEEIVRAFSWVIEKGWAFYWATSEWSAQEIDEAHGIAQRLGLHAPIAEQCEHRCVFHCLVDALRYCLLTMFWVACSIARDLRKNMLICTRSTAWALLHSVVWLVVFSPARYILLTISYRSRTSTKNT